MIIWTGLTKILWHNFVVNVKKFVKWKIIRHKILSILCMSFSRKINAIGCLETLRN